MIVVFKELKQPEDKPEAVPAGEQRQDALSVITDGANEQQIGEANEPDRPDEPYEKP